MNEWIVEQIVMIDVKQIDLVEKKIDKKLDGIYYQDTT